MKPVPQVFGVRFRVVKSSSCTLVWIVFPGSAAWVSMLFSASFIAVTLSLVLASCLSSWLPCVLSGPAWFSMNRLRVVGSVVICGFTVW